MNPQASVQLHVQSFDQIKFKPNKLQAHYQNMAMNLSKTKEITASDKKNIVSGQS